MGQTGLRVMIHNPKDLRLNLDLNGIGDKLGSE